MKKTLLVIAITALSFSAFAQFQIGLKGGLNLTKLKGAYAMGTFGEAAKDETNKLYEMKSGLGYGVVMSMGNDGFRFQPEFMYMQRGANIKDSKMEARTNYFDTKLLFNVGGGNEAFKIYGQFGPSFNFWLSKGLYDNGDLVPGSDEWNKDSGILVKVSDVRFDISVLVGIEGRLKMGPGWLLLNPRYELGLLPQTIFEMGDDDGYGIVNRDISINLGYLFEF